MSRWFQLKNQFFWQLIFQFASYVLSPSSQTCGWSRYGRLIFLRIFGTNHMHSKTSEHCGISLTWSIDYRMFDWNFKAFTDVRTTGSSLIHLFIPTSLTNSFVYHKKREFIPHREMTSPGMLNIKRSTNHCISHYIWHNWGGMWQYTDDKIFPLCWQD